MAEEKSSSSGEPNEDLTVDDILSTEQTDEAAAGDDAGDSAIAAEPGETATDEAPDYLDDLRRLTAEFANYRKRTEDNREIERQRATATALVSLLPVLDDFDRAEKHGDLVEGSAFYSIAQKMRGSVEKLGLTTFGEEGEVFDPSRHEAITQVPTPGIAEATVLEVFERGYKIGDVELRPAKVVVAVPVDG